MNSDPVKKRIIRRRKPSPNQLPIDAKPKKKRIIKRKKQATVSAPSVVVNDFQDFSSNSENEEVTVFVKPWMCSSNSTEYLLDPITQEVFDKFSHGFIGFRYKSEDEVSLIDYS